MARGQPENGKLKERQKEKIWFALNKYGKTPAELYLIEFEFAIIALFGFIGLKIKKNKWISKT